MLNLECKNGSIEILSVRETRNFSNGMRMKMVDITIDGQKTTLDTVEDVLTIPEMVTDFTITNSKTGVVMGKFEGYTLSNLSRNAQGDRVSNMVSFMKEGN